MASSRRRPSAPMALRSARRVASDERRSPPSATSTTGSSWAASWRSGAPMTATSTCGRTAASTEVSALAGHNEGREPRCQYHGWRYANRTAGCTYIPAHPADSPPRTVGTSLPRDRTLRDVVDGADAAAGHLRHCLAGGSPFGLRGLRSMRRWFWPPSAAIVVHAPARSGAAEGVSGRADWVELTATAHEASDRWSSSSSPRAPLCRARRAGARARPGQADGAAPPQFPAHSVA